MIKETRIILSLISVAIIILVGYLLIQYTPFIREELAFELEYNDDKTHVINKNFNIEFDINKKCKLDSEPLNYISYRHGPWLGNFICDANRDIKLYVRDYNEDLLNNRKEYNTYQGSMDIFINYQPDGSMFNFLTILSKDKTKILELSIRDENEHMFNSIVESLRPY